MDGKCLESPTVLQFAWHVLGEMTFNSGFAIGTLLYLCINMFGSNSLTGGGRMESILRLKHKIYLTY